MSYRYALRCATAAAVLTVATAQERTPQPETVMIVLHAKPGSEADLASTLARHWSAVRKLNLVQDAPHLTVRATEEGNKTYFMETITWRDGSIPDAAPAPIQAIWAEMNRSVEPRGGKPAIEIVPVSILSPAATGPTP
jgi:hypothetical protein